VRVGSVADFEPTGRVGFRHDGRELVAFRLGEDYVAFEDVCPHLGGPVCQGKLARRLVAEVAADGGVVERFSETDVNLVCPWHGFEFDVRTGVAIADRRYRLRRLELERIGDEVHVVA
jgi:nitrite reductase/ring-hydroxylating ferredoxin subunit